MRNKTKLTLRCDWCEGEFMRYPSQVKAHNFCSRKCLAKFSNKTSNPEHYRELKNYAGQSKNMTEINQKMNPYRMDFSTRYKLRKAQLAKGNNGNTYAKMFGHHEHRILAERKIGRPLKPNEAVHHADGDRRNNNSENLVVMTASDHARFHTELRRFWFRKWEDNA